MPGVYGPGEYDLAGFCVGAVERGALLPRLGDICEGDLLIGVASSGVHSNGFSLVRKVLERAGVTYSSPAPFGKPGQTVGRLMRSYKLLHRVNLCFFEREFLWVCLPNLLSYFLLKGGKWTVLWSFIFSTK